MAYGYINIYYLGRPSSVHAGLSRPYAGAPQPCPADCQARQPCPAECHGTPALPGRVPVHASPARPSASTEPGHASPCRPSAGAHWLYPLSQGIPALLLGHTCPPGRRCQTKQLSILSFNLKALINQKGWG